MNRQPGYYVFNPKGAVPRYLHDTLEGAQQEAQRLARLIPGQTFVVLATVGAFELPAPGPVWTQLEPTDRAIPF